MKYSRYVGIIDRDGLTGEQISREQSAGHRRGAVEQLGVGHLVPGAHVAEDTHVQAIRVGADMPGENVDERRGVVRYALDLEWLRARVSLPSPARAFAGDRDARRRARHAVSRPLPAPPKEG